MLERVEHLLQRARERGDLVVGLRLRDRAVGVAGLGDVARRGREALDRGHRAAPEDEPAQEGEQRAGQHAGAEEEPDPVHGGLHVGDLAPVLQDHRQQQVAEDAAVGRLDLHRALAYLDA